MDRSRPSSNSPSSTPFPSVRRPHSSHGPPPFSSRQQLPPYPNRRPLTAPRGLRSSPLAGPSLSASEDDDDDSALDKPRYRPSRISSTPDFPVGAVQSIYPTLPPKKSFSLETDSISISPSCGHAEDGDDDDDRPAPRSRHSRVRTGGSNSVSGKSSKPDNSRLASRGSYTGQQLKLPAVPYVPPRRPSSMYLDPGENWMSATDPVPKFTRLSLGGQGVVMPIAASRRRTDSMNSTTSSRKDTSSIISESPPTLFSRPPSAISTISSPPISTIDAYPEKTYPEKLVPLRSASMQDFAEMGNTELNDSPSDEKLHVVIPEPKEKRRFVNRISNLFRRPKRASKTSNEASRSTPNLLRKSRERQRSDNLRKRLSSMIFD